jgi:hypothetical protein
MEVSSFVADLIKNISVDNYRELKLEAKKHSLDEWIDKHIIKAGWAGNITGAIGGPFSLFLEAADMAYLGRLIGRLCFGIGYIKNKPVCSQSDIESILAIWTEIAIPISRKELKEEFKNNFYLEIKEEYEKYLELESLNKRNSFFRKLLAFFSSNKKQSTTQDKLLSFEEFEEKLFEKYLSEITIINKMVIDDSEDVFSKYLRETIFTLRLTGKMKKKSLSKVGVKLGTKILSKKGIPKLTSKIASKAGTKLSSKVAGKVSTKWIPIIGGVTSAGINIWIITSIAEAAKQYYDADYIRIKTDMSRDILDEIHNKLLDLIM